MACTASPLRPAAASPGEGRGGDDYESASAELVARGVSGVHLDADRRNDRAIGFYTHLGFLPLEAGEDVIVMGKLLDQE